MSKNSFSLELLDVKSPCTFSWDKMQGDERVRFCPECRLSVYNVSAMAFGEISQLIRQKQGRLCIRFARRADGTVVTLDYRRTRGLRRGYALAVGIVASTFAVAVGCLLMLAGVIERDKDRNRGSSRIDPFGIVPNQRNDDCKHTQGSFSPRDEPQQVDINGVANPP
jgi:hypothetical protein